MAAAALAAGCAGTPATTAGDRAAAPANTDCVRTSLIRDWDALDERNLIVYETGGRPYHVELAQTCFGVDFEVMLGFYDRRGDGRICGYGLDRVIVDRAIPESCSVAAVDELTDEQAEELKQRAETSRARR
jgi:hypothetical protein